MASVPIEARSRRGRSGRAATVPRTASSGARSPSTRALTLLWLFYVWVRPSEYFFKDLALDWQGILGVVIGFLFFNVLWGFVWWGVKGSLLKRFVGMTPEETRRTFESRMDKPFDVADFTARYSERRIRIVDMIGRRGRFGIMALSGFFFFYLNVKDGDAERLRRPLHARQPAGGDPLQLAVPRPSSTRTTSSRERCSARSRASWTACWRGRTAC